MLHNINAARGYLLVFVYVQMVHYGTIMSRNIHQCVKGEASSVGVEASLHGFLFTFMNEYK